MKEMRYGGNLFLLPKGNEAGVVTTNGILKSDGRLVMGAGIAKYARDNFRDIDMTLGALVSKHGSHSYFLGSYEDAHRSAEGLAPNVFVLSMPTKRHWRDPSDIGLIVQSAVELSVLATRNNLEAVYLPAPGCSNGQLDYASQVRPAIAKVLDSRFIVCLAPDVYDKLHPEKSGTGTEG